MPKKTELSDEDQALREVIGAAIRKAAKARDLKPQDIAQTAGVSLAQQYRVENGEATPDAIYLFKVAALLGVPVDALLRGEVPPSSGDLPADYHASAPEHKSHSIKKTPGRTSAPASEPAKGRKRAA